MASAEGRRDVAISFFLFSVYRSRSYVCTKSVCNVASPIANPRLSFKVGRMGGNGERGNGEGKGRKKKGKKGI